ncbi:MAG: hypothetical protein EOO60_01365 [Hymenobacter sp.]|nr:MAG: hypothetical protein EOO60_01365 [Hymenobacter sp.]
MALTLDLPTSRQAERPYREIENVLAQLRTQVESRYNQKIAVLLLTTSKFDADELPISHKYEVKLSFIYRHYTETVMELNCRVGQGYPVEVCAFRGVVGQATTRAELEKLIELVFLDQRTRNIILLNY